MSRRRLAWIAATLALGAAGGFAFDLAGMPAGWLAGAMVAVALAAVAGLPVDLPMPMRDVAFVVLGAVLGATMDRSSLASLPQWPASVAGLLLGLALLVTAVPYYLRRVHGIEAATARMCAIPGALGYVVALAMEFRVDARRVAILHTLRLAVLLTLIPAVVALAHGEGAVSPAAAASPLAWPQAAALLAAAFAAVPVARRLRFPAPTFLAPMVLTAALRMAGVVEAPLPQALLWPSLAVSGAVVGSRFAGTSPAYLFESVKAGLGGIALAIALMGLVAWPVAAATRLPFVQVWLAYAPGGFDAMPVLAFSLGLDPAFVAGHQLIRFLAISAVLPFLFRPPPP